MSEMETPRRCVNEACPRPAEPGERFCSACGLERSLFRRERREDPAEIRSGEWGNEPGR